MFQLYSTIIIGVITGLISDWVKHWILKKTKNNNDMTQTYSKESLKKQYYICFPIALLLSLSKGIVHTDSFWHLFMNNTSYLLLFLCLFAFMCAIERIDSLEKQLSKYEPHSEAE